MTAPTGSDTPPHGTDADAAELQADVERTRAQLGSTVEALTEKLDVTALARKKVEDVPRPVVVGAGALALGLVVLLIWRARR